MKTKVYVILLLLINWLPTHLLADTNASDNCSNLTEDSPCWMWLECSDAPDYYCDCHDAIPFRYGLDTIITDTTWFSAKLSDVSDGLTAYWFASNSVKFDIFFTCVQDTVTMSFAIGKNSAYNVDMTEIKEKLDKYGSVIGGVISAFPIRIRVAPRGGVSGRAILLPYNKGPHSVCADPLPAIYNIQYLSSDPDNVYRLSLSATPKPMLVRWVQQNNRPTRMELTYGTCEGEPVASRVLADSSKVFVPELSLLQKAYDEQQPLYFHFYSQSTGKISFRSPFQTDTRSENISACQGKGLQLADTTLLEPTAYCDTVYLVDAETAVGTLWLNTYNLTINPPTEVKQTIELTEKQFPYLYRGQAVVTGYGTYSFLIQEKGKCDQLVELTVVRPATTGFPEPLSRVTVTPTLAHAGQPIAVEGLDRGTLHVVSALGKSVLSMPLTGHDEFALPVAGQYMLLIQTEQGNRQIRIVIL